MTIVLTERVRVVIFSGFALVLIVSLIDIKRQKTTKLVAKRRRDLSTLPDIPSTRQTVLAAGGEGRKISILHNNGRKRHTTDAKRVVPQASPNRVFIGTHTSVVNDQAGRSSSPLHCSLVDLFRYVI